MRMLIALPLPLLLIACATSPEQIAAREEAQAARVPAATPTGPAESCVQTSRIRQTHVRNDRVIDFEMIGGEVYRNTLPQSCPRLGFEERFAYKTQIGQLCSVDTITVFGTSPGVDGPTCGLGTFQPVALAKN